RGGWGLGEEGPGQKCSQPRLPPFVYPFSLTHSPRSPPPRNPCSPPKPAANRIVARRPLLPLAASLLNPRAHSTLTAVPDASSSAPGASAFGSMTSDGRESKCPDTTKTVFAITGSAPGKIAYTFCKG